MIFQVTPTPTSISDLGQRKSKKKRAASPVPSESSGEEYDPSNSAGNMSVAASRPRISKPKTRKSNTTKSKDTFIRKRHLLNSND